VENFFEKKNSLKRQRGKMPAETAGRTSSGLLEKITVSGAPLRAAVVYDLHQLDARVDVRPCPKRCSIFSIGASPPVFRRARESSSPDPRSAARGRGRSALSVFLGAARGFLDKVWGLLKMKLLSRILT